MAALLGVSVEQITNDARISWTRVRNKKKPTRDKVVGRGARRGVGLGARDKFGRNLRHRLHKNKNIYITPRNQDREGHGRYNIQQSRPLSLYSVEEHWRAEH